MATSQKIDFEDIKFIDEQILKISNCMILSEDSVKALCAKAKEILTTEDNC